MLCLYTARSMSGRTEPLFAYNVYVNVSICMVSATVQEEAAFI